MQREVGFLQKFLQGMGMAEKNTSFYVIAFNVLGVQQRDTYVCSWVHNMPVPMCLTLCFILTLLDEIFHLSLSCLISLNL